LLKTTKPPSGWASSGFSQLFRLIMQSTVRITASAPK
jgi:hypothetical protein